MTLLFQPVVHGIVLGGEEHYGALLSDGEFLELERPDLGNISRISVIGDGLGLVLPCRAEILDEREIAVAIAEIEVENGNIMCTAIRALPGQQLTGKLLRQVPISRLVREAAANGVVHLRKGFAVRFVTGPFGVERPDLQEPRKVDDDFLGEVASVYREAVAIGITPALAIKRRFGTTPGNARRWVMQARKRGLLGPARGIGKAGEA